MRYSSLLKSAKLFYSSISNKVSIPHYAELNGLYDKTIANLAINKTTRVICQGFTGKQVSSRFYLVLLVTFTFYIGNLPFWTSYCIWY